MSLAFQNKTNKLFSHQTSIDERKPPSTEIGPVGQLKLRQADEMKALEGRIQEKQKKLHGKQLADKERDHRYRHNGEVPQHLSDEHRRQQQAFSQSAAQDRADLKNRHRAQIEAALAKHGIAP